MTNLSKEVKEFIQNSTWIFAKTYAATWPHEYIVQQRVDRIMFDALAAHIDCFGYESDFYDTKQIYFDYDGNTYWHMGNIINRCPKNETYRCRKEQGRLPKNFSE